MEISGKPDRLKNRHGHKNPAYIGTDTVARGRFPHFYPQEKWTSQQEGKAVSVVLRCSAKVRLYGDRKGREGALRD